MHRSSFVHKPLTFPQIWGNLNCCPSLYIGIDGTLRWRHNGRDSASPASPLFTQPFIRVQIKENTEAPRHWPLCGEFTGDRWIPRTNGQLRGKCFHLMRSSWSWSIFYVIQLQQFPTTLIFFQYAGFIVYLHGIQWSKVSLFRVSW